MKHIKEISNEKLNKIQVQELINERFKDEKSDLDFDPYSAFSDSETQEVVEVSKPTARVMTRGKLFDQFMRLERKGFYKVWKTRFNLQIGRNVDMYLHAVNDSKPVYQISTRYAALPKKKLQMITKSQESSGKKIKKEVPTSPAHVSFRKQMGFNDQSDAKRSFIGLSTKYYKM